MHGVYEAVDALPVEVRLSRLRRVQGVELSVEVCCDVLLYLEGCCDVHCMYKDVEAVQAEVCLL